MNVSKKLQTLPALLIQGFVAGGILFFTLQPLEGGQRDAPSPSQSQSVIATLQV